MEMYIFLFIVYRYHILTKTNPIFCLTADMPWGKVNGR